MLTKRWLTSLGAGMLVATATIATADTVSIAEKLNSGATVPTRGMSMEMVENRFGTPNTRKLPVGSPPIIRWHYDNFRVYFENEFVIHSVAN